MKTPLIYVEDSALIFEAAMLLQEEDIDYLVIRDEHDAVLGVISNEELLDVHRYSANFVIEQIRTATSVEEIVQSHYRLPRIIKALNDSGAHARNITRIITTISDTVLERLVDMAIEEIGEPPVRFVAKHGVVTHEVGESDHRIECFHVARFAVVLGQARCHDAFLKMGVTLAGRLRSHRFDRPLAAVDASITLPS